MTATRPLTPHDFVEFVIAYVRDSDETDVQALADSLLAELDDDAREVALRTALPRLLRDALARLRSEDERALRTPSPPPISRRWDNVRAAVESGELAHWRVNAGGVNRFLLDCGAGDLRTAADYHQRTAHGHARRAGVYSRLAEALDERELSSVRDLDSDTLASIFEGE